ncbi:hemicentin-1-like [Bolinopsis microptera]|uniref:hemicentin-1-like n=1 Tax=Bolinopsis microptera TaxID=2820187 RepID=UPI003079C6F7
MKILMLLIVVLVGVVFSKGTLDVKEKGGQCHKKMEKTMSQYRRKCLERGFEGTLGYPFDSSRNIKDMRNHVLRGCLKMDAWLAGCNAGGSNKVDGNWSEFSAWSECSASCGGGVTERSRTCDNPAPGEGGNDCEGSAAESEGCNNIPCVVVPDPVNGGWSEWTTFTECSAPCGLGITIRARSCSNPAPAFGGQNCEGDSSEEIECDAGPCPVDGNWSDYSAWSECSASCGGGVMERSRNCDSPAPENGGNPCDGEAADNQACNPDPCHVDGQWSEWGDYGECSVECGTGFTQRERSCDSPAAAYGGQECIGDAVNPKTKKCKGRCRPGPNDGNWSEFTEWSKCSRQCGGGVMKRSRKCDNPKPKHGGRLCGGEEAEMKVEKEQMVCNEEICSKNGSWGRWKKIQGCFGPDSGCEKIRQRVCEMPIGGGAPCEGDSELRTICLNKVGQVGCPAPVEPVK